MGRRGVMSTNEIVSLEEEEEEEEEEHKARRSIFVRAATAIEIKDRTMVEAEDKAWTKLEALTYSIALSCIRTTETKNRDNSLALYPSI